MIVSKGTQAMVMAWKSPVRSMKAIFRLKTYKIIKRLEPRGKWFQIITRWDSGSSFPSRNLFFSLLV